MKRILLGVLLLAGLLPRAQPAFACTCIVRALPEQIDAASVVFTGTVRGIRPLSKTQLSIALDVSAVYKGEARRSVSVTTTQVGTGCGAPFAPETSYAVFAVGEAGALTTGICDGTTDDVSIVAGLAPIETFAAPDGELPGDEPGSRSLPIGTAAGLFTLVLAASMWAWMMRARPPRPLV